MQFAGLQGVESRYTIVATTQRMFEPTGKRAWSLTPIARIGEIDATNEGVLTMMNCWEFKKCGREPGGAKVTELGECPAAQLERLDGENHGRNGGRMCWLVSATLCGNEIQGDFYSKLGNCLKCDFLKTVHKEEGTAFSYGMKHWFEMCGMKFSDSPEAK